METPFSLSNVFLNKAIAKPFNFDAYTPKPPIAIPLTTCMVSYLLHGVTPHNPTNNPLSVSANGLRPVIPTPLYLLPPMNSPEITRPLCFLAYAASPPI